MITSKEIKVKIPQEFTSQYIEDELKKTGYDILRWVITGFDSQYYLVNIAVVED